MEGLPENVMADILSAPTAHGLPECIFPFEDLPGNVMVDILSRLPCKTICSYKCVCKDWQNLMNEPYYANTHLSRLPPAGLIIFQNFYAGILKWVEIKEELDHRHLHHDPVNALDLNLVPVLKNSYVKLVGSVNGLLCLWDNGFNSKCDNTYICNPVTRECITLPRKQYCSKGPARTVHGFGVGLKTRKYKVVRIFQGNIPPDPPSSSGSRLLEAEVYTLGTGQWRSLGHVPYWLNDWDEPFLNGCVHWMLYDENFPEKLCSFDIDKETFQLFPSPPFDAFDDTRIPEEESLAVLKGCLCQSHTFVTGFTIWVMKEYGIKKSWHKEVVIKRSISRDLDWPPLYIIGGLEDGTILMVYYIDEVLAYCPETKTCGLSSIDASAGASRRLPSIIQSDTGDDVVIIEVKLDHLQREDHRLVHRYPCHLGAIPLLQPPLLPWKRGIAPVAIIDRQLPFEYTITSRSTDVMVFHQLKLALRVEKKIYVIEQPIPPAPAADSAANVLAEWNAVYDAHNDELRSMFEKQARVERFDIIQTFHACKQEEGKSVSQYILKMKGYVEQLERLGYVLSQDLSVGLILNGLTSDFVTHICITKQGLRGARKLKQGDLYLYVGNGVRAQVEAIGSFDLVLPNGLVICLDNCHYAHSITRGVVSVSCLVKNRFAQCFTDYRISVSRNDILYFNAIPSNGVTFLIFHVFVRLY
ncbi:F-box associated domain containing protein [Tanacetum coccineum]